MTYRIAALLGMLAWLPLASAEKVAVTFDDLPLNGTLPGGVNEADLVDRVLPILQRYRLPPVYAFINGQKLENNPNGARALRRWVAGGQRVGNHTYSHIDLSRHEPKEFIGDVLRNEPVLQLLARDDEWRWFRYPYLHEGDTHDKRQAVRYFLRDHGYSIAQTTLDYEDYLWNSAYARCATMRDAQAMEWLRSSYLEVAAGYLDGNRAMAQSVFGRKINHVLLLHLGAFSPEILPALFDLMRSKGFEFVTLAEAQSDPIYASDPQFVHRQTGTLVEQHMDARKLPYPSLPQKPRERLDTICR